MQVMPATGRTIARRTGTKLDPRRLAVPAVNVQFGAAELRSLLDNYQNNYVLTFAAYNAGRGNVAKWIAAYGDPRDPAIDPIDWVERIPFSETRNYVQRVMENAQVYKSRFGSRDLAADRSGPARLAVLTSRLRPGGRGSPSPFQLARRRPPNMRRSQQPPMQPTR
ncbi:lytic transglycosylase domain-containing protein [Ancylobacter dichloromethanicus]